MIQAWCGNLANEGSAHTQVAWVDRLKFLLSDTYSPSQVYEPAYSRNM